MNNLKPYTKYKPSNIAWLGDIPEHWEVRKLKYSLNINNGSDYKHIQSDSGYPVIGSGGQFAYAKEFMFDGEVVFLGRKGTIDKPLYFKGKFWAVDTMFYANGKNGNNVKFHYYVSTQIPFRLYSTSTALPSMTQTDLKEHYLAYPSIPEQTAIANFLDYKLSKIDRFIQKKKQLIKLLNEQKAGIINDAVTKGLNPNAKMKPSGIEWLGDIPEHWEVRKLSTLIKHSELGGNYDSSESSQGIAVMKMGNIDRGKIKLNKIEYLESNIQFDSKHILQNGDFLFNTRNSAELVGKVAVWRNEIPESLYNSNILKICFKEGVANEYMNMLFNSRSILNILKLISKGTTNVSAIYYKDLSKIDVWLPKLDEQIAIFSYIETETEKLDQTISTIEKEIALTQEYRVALIAEAVTGKIDVRDYEIPETPVMELYEELEDEMSLAAEEEVGYSTEN